MAVTPVFGTVATVAAVLGLVQGIVWSAASIVGIVVSTTCIFRLGDGAISTDTAFILYVSGSVCGDATIQDQYGTMSTEWFLAWSCLFLSFNFIWFCSSVWFLVGLKRHKAKHVLLELLAWVLITFCVCILDLAATIRFGIDYNILQNIDGEKMYAVAPAVLMTVAARGFVLYLFNVALFISLTVMGLRIYEEKKEDEKQLTQHTSVASLFQPSSADNSLSSRRGATNYSSDPVPWSTLGDDPGPAPWRLPRPVIRPQPQHLVPRVPVPLTPPPRLIPDPDYSPFPIRRPPSTQSSSTDRTPRSVLKKPPSWPAGAHGSLSHPSKGVLQDRPSLRSALRECHSQVTPAVPWMRSWANHHQEVQRKRLVVWYEYRRVYSIPHYTSELSSTSPN